MPHGFTWGLVLLKNLPKPPIPVRTYMSKKSFLKVCRESCGSNTSWNYVVVNVSLRSHIIHHNQSGFSRPNHKGEKGEKINIHNVVNMNESDKYI